MVYIAVTELCFRDGTAVEAKIQPFIKYNNKRIINGRTNEIATVGRPEEVDTDIEKASRK